jgi:hypothetical protein
MKPGKNEPDEEGQAFLPISRNSEDVPTPLRESRETRWRVWWHLRILLELAMATTIIFLLFFRSVPERHTIRKTPVPQRMPKISHVN